LKNLYVFLEGSGHTAAPATIVTVGARTNTNDDDDDSEELLAFEDFPEPVQMLFPNGLPDITVDDLRRSDTTRGLEIHFHSLRPLIESSALGAQMTNFSNRQRQRTAAVEQSFVDSYKSSHYDRRTIIVREAEMVTSEAATTTSRNPYKRNEKQKQSAKGEAIKEENNKKKLRDEVVKRATYSDKL
jgi:hypothetical protein